MNDKNECNRSTQDIGFIGHGDQHIETLESLENGYVKQEEATAILLVNAIVQAVSCISIRSMEPLSRVLEPVMVRHLDIYSPELVCDRDDNIDDTFLIRTLIISKDPGAVGPIVFITIKCKEYLSLHNLSKDLTCLKVTIRPKWMSMECTITRKNRLQITRPTCIFL